MQKINKIYFQMMTYLDKIKMINYKQMIYCLHNRNLQTLKIILIIKTNLSLFKKIYKMTNKTLTFLIIFYKMQSQLQMSSINNKKIRYKQIYFNNKFNKKMIILMFLILLKKIISKMLLNKVLTFLINFFYKKNPNNLKKVNKQNYLVSLLIHNFGILQMNNKIHLFFSIKQKVFFKIKLQMILF